MIRSKGIPAIGPIARRKRGKVQIAATTNRRHRSRCPASAWDALSELKSGSSAIPQIGQLAGRSLVTSGHMGQKYRVPSGTGAVGLGAGFKNFVRQYSLQKYQFLPSFSQVNPVRGSTDIPQMGSISIWLDGSSRRTFRMGNLTVS